MPDILLDSLFSLLPKLDTAAAARSARERKDVGPAFDQHLEQAEKSAARPADDGRDLADRRRTAERRPARPERVSNSDDRGSANEQSRSQDPASKVSRTDRKPSETSTGERQVAEETVPALPEETETEDQPVDVSAAEIVAGEAAQKSQVAVGVASAVQEATVNLLSRSLPHLNATAATGQPALPTGEGQDRKAARAEQATAKTEQPADVAVATEALADGTLVQATAVAASDLAANQAQADAKSSSSAGAQNTETSAKGTDSSTPSITAQSSGTSLERTGAPSTGQIPAAVAATVNQPAPQAASASAGSPTRSAAGSESAGSAGRTGSNGEQPAPLHDGQLRTPGHGQRQFSPRLGPTATTPEAHLHGLSQMERVQLVQRVARAFQAAGEDGGVLRLRLSPPELGALRMEVSVRDGGMYARIEAETPQAQAALLDNLPALRERLAERDLRLERFDVELPNRQPADGWSQQSSEQQRERFGGDRRTEPRRADPGAPLVGPVMRPAGAGGLDVTI